MIGIFDSGIWGLSYAKELNKKMPKYDFVYFWDQLRVPYGNRSIESIRNFTEECVTKLWEQGATLIIIACNTASAEALRFLQNKYPNKKILGVLIPGVEKALEWKWNIWIVATRWTVKTETYPAEILKRNSNRKVFQVEAPLLVPFIEENKDQSSIFKKILKTYLRPLKDANVKRLILGCTHYSHAMKAFKSIMWFQIEIINPSTEAVIKLIDYLKRHQEIDNTLSKKGTRRFLTTDNIKFFEKQAISFYWKKVKVEKIDL